MKITNQAIELIKRSKTIVIVPTPNLQGDSLGGSLALFYTLKKIEKDVNIFLKEIPKKFQFLTSQDCFVISIDTQGKEVEQMNYEKNEKDLKVYLTLGQGQIKDCDIRWGHQNSPQILQEDRECLKLNPDLLITLGVPNLESLGEIFEKNPKFFYEAPILNIDNQPSNENFGEVNLLDLTSLSLAEILTDLIRSIDQALLDGNIATHLLAGLISASQNFQNPRTRPKTFESASYLIERGADHQKIIQNLYRQKSVAQIKLLGKILEKLEFNEKREIYSSCLKESDFQSSGASSKDLGPVIEELKFNFWKLPSLLLLWESHASPPIVKGVFYSKRGDLINKILENFEGVNRGEGVLFLVRSGDLDFAKREALKHLEQ